MAMAHKGLAKLIEECGEVSQVAGKLLAYPDGDHPDGKGNLRDRLKDELGDLGAAIQLTIEAMNLEGADVWARREKKLNIFRNWHSDPDN